jgi:hypothetical protein
MQGSSDVRLGGLNSYAGVPLAGPWAPICITGDSPLPQMSAQPSIPTPTAAPQPAALRPAEPAASREADDDLDSLLASLDAPAEATSSDSDMDADLAAMLADL